MLSTIAEITGVGAASRTPYNALERLPAGSLAGKVYLVTGGHGGIGLATTKFLALAGARVLVASRTRSKYEAAVDKLATEHGEELRSRFAYYELDLASLKQVARCGDEIAAKEERLDGIVCNAGVDAVPYKLTEDGIEQQFQVNYLGHWLLVQKLLPLLEKTADLTGHPSRVVTLSSWAHTWMAYYPFASLKFTSVADINRTYYSTDIRYSVSKLVMIFFARELNRRVTSGKVKALSVHPGFVASNLFDHQHFFKLFTRFFISTDQGAYSSLHAAADPEVEQKQLWGEYLVPFCKKIEPTGGKDEVKERELWELSEAIVREKVGGL
ncbi:hypothetical protein JCM8097_000364 [Rhodosporidiobolus ruineniae]